MLKTCARPECQILYSSSRNGMYCATCKEIVDAAFQTIRDLLVENPDATVAEIHRTTQIPFSIIESLVKSGRLAYVHSDQCKHCRRTLDPGSTTPGLCDRCARMLRNDLVSRMSKRPGQATNHAKPVPGMHVSLPQSD